LAALIPNMMRPPAILLGLLCLGFLLFVTSTAYLMPDPVASHFNAHGQPDAWMARSSYVLLMSAMGLALPLFVTGITYTTRFFPDSTVNLPHKEYWLSTEQRPLTHAYLFEHSMWLASLVVCLMAGAHFLIIQANRNVPAQLPGLAFVVLMAGFLVGVAIWAIALVRHFRRPG